MCDAYQKGPIACHDNVGKLIFAVLIITRIKFNKYLLLLVKILPIPSLPFLHLPY